MEAKHVATMVTLAVWMTLFLCSSLPFPSTREQHGVRTLGIDANQVERNYDEEISDDLVKVVAKRHAWEQEDETNDHERFSKNHRLLNSDDLKAFSGQTNTSRLSNTTLTHLKNDRVTQMLQMRYRERKKQERLMSIQAQILQNLRVSRRPNISSNVFSEEEQRKINAMVQKVNSINDHHGKVHGKGHGQIVRPTRQRDVENPVTGHPESRSFHPQATMQWLQSFYPSCDLPNNTDRAIWELPETFRIYYDIPLKRYLLGSKVTVLLSKLRLYKNQLQHHSYDHPNDEESELTVSIYQLLRPLRFNKRERKRLIDTVIVAINKKGWIEFNVLSSLNFWLHHAHRNFGFDVQVEDNEGNKMDPNMFFRNLNCSFGETALLEPAFPNLRGIHPEMVGENESSLFDDETYPTLDLQMADASTTYNTFSFDHLVRSSATRTSDTRQERVLKKRHLPDQCSHSNVCQNETIFITFAELGLDDVVISPLGFEWTFCPYASLKNLEGKPPQLSLPSPFIQHIYSVWNFLIRKSINRKELHCIPTGWTSLSILYFNEETNLQYKLLRDFLPTTCSCRTS